MTYSTSTTRPAGVTFLRAGDRKGNPFVVALDEIESIGDVANPTPGVESVIVLKSGRWHLSSDTTADLLAKFTDTDR
jgi:hypothetical protein